MGSSSNGASQFAEPAWRNAMRNGMGGGSPPPMTPGNPPPGQGGAIPGQGGTPPGAGGMQGRPNWANRGDDDDDRNGPQLPLTPEQQAWQTQMQTLWGARPERPPMSPEWQAWQAQRPEGMGQRPGMEAWRDSRSTWQDARPETYTRAGMEAWRDARPARPAMTPNPAMEAWRDLRPAMPANPALDAWKQQVQQLRTTMPEGMNYGDFNSRMRGNRG